MSRNHLLHVECQCSHLFGMVAALDGHAGNSHVCITDGFNFLGTMLLAEVVELCENQIQQADQLLRTDSLGESRKTHDIGE